jgi:hypothetical protein
MPDKVLYFPYVRVPNSTWFTRILLYWDEVGTLVPYDFLEFPERLGEHTRSLVEKELVTQVIPGSHVYRIPRFTEAFIDRLDRLGPGMDHRRQSFERDKIFTIYSEKMFGVSDALVKLKLARKSRSHTNVFDVEEQTGFEFMAYLAMTLGQLDDLQFTPVADEDRVLENLALFGSPTSVEELDRIRLEILEEALPAPSQPLLASEILEFKLDHGKQLGRFRRYLEKELITIAAIPDKELRNRRLQLTREEIKAEVGDIQSKMQARGWLTVTVEKLSALLAPIPGLKPVPDIVKAVLDAYGGEKPNLESPLAYAAFAQEKLLDQ